MTLNRRHQLILVLIILIAILILAVVIFMPTDKATGVKAPIKDIILDVSNIENPTLGETVPIEEIIPAPKADGIQSPSGENLQESGKVN